MIIHELYHTRDKLKSVNMENNDNSDRKISVVVMAYNRDKYILEALDSISQQTLSREYYEVIVIKNFHSSKVDNFIKEHGYKSLFLREPTLAPEMLWYAIKECSNEIITFLEDDDLFMPDRLEHIFDQFRGMPDLGFYRNGTTLFFNEDSPGRKEPEKFKKVPDTKIVLRPPKYGYEVICYDAAFNISSMAISKEAINMDHFRTLITNQDMFMLFSAMSQSKPLLIDNQTLTRSRLHDDNVSFKRSKDEELKFLKKYNQSYYQILGLLTGKPAMIYLLDVYMVGSFIEHDRFYRDWKALLIRDLPKLLKKSIYVIMTWDPEKSGNFIRAILLHFWKSAKELMDDQK